MTKFGPLAVLALTAACTSESSEPSLSPPESLPEDGRTFVINSIEVGGSAAEASALAIDLDGDDRPDNAFGQSLALAESTLNIDLDAEIAASLDRGELLHLLLFASDKTGDVLDTGRLFLGADTDAEPSNNFSGEAELAIREDSELDGAAFGFVGAREVDLAGGRLTVENVLFAPIRLRLVGARITGFFGDAGGFAGTIAGGIPTDELARLRADIASAIAEEANAMCDATQIPCCPDNSRGEVYMTYFDADNDCHLGATEVADNDILTWLTAPDLDVDGDGLTDAMSVAFGVTAVPARFEVRN